MQYYAEQSEQALEDALSAAVEAGAITRDRRTCWSIRGRWGADVAAVSVSVVTRRLPPSRHDTRPRWPQDARRRRGTHGNPGRSKLISQALFWRPSNKI